MQFFALVAKSALALLFLLTVAVAQKAGSDNRTVFDIINDTPELSQFSSLLGSTTEAGKIMRNPNESITVFAPTDTTISGSSATVEVLYHMSSQRVLFAKGPSLEIVYTQLASPFSFDVVGVSRESGKNSVLYSNQKANVVRADIIASNGVVHIIDSVLREPLMLEDTCDALGIAKFEASLRKIKLEGMVYWQPNRTTFVPTDEAMSKLPNDIDDQSLHRILRYHSVRSVTGIPTGSDNTLTMVSDNDLELQVVVNDTGSFVNGVHVSMANYIVREGMMHVIDGVITGPAPSLSDDGSNGNGSDNNNTDGTSKGDNGGIEENNASGDSGGKLSPAVIAVITVLAVVVLGAVGVALYLRRKRKSNNHDGASPASLISDKDSKGFRAFGKLKSRLSSNSSSVLDDARAELGVSATFDSQSEQPAQPAADSSKVVGTGQPFVPNGTGQPMS